jgi:hypothetical protein
MSRQNDLSPEDQLLLLLARGRLTPEVRGEAQSLLEEALPWPYILRQAQAQEVSPLFYRNLKQLGFRSVPPEVRAELEAFYRSNALWNTLCARELMQVLRLLGEAGVRVIPLKGVALAESLYGDITLRVCADIDILVPRRMVAQAFRLLLFRGYSAEFTEGFFEDLLRRSDIEYALLREEQWFRYLLELHWGICWEPSLDEGAAEDLWTEAHVKTFFGVPAYTLSPEWEILYLAAHAARHQWTGLKWLVDIHEVCSRGGVDWGKVREKAGKLGWEEMLELTLSACHALFNTSITADFSAKELPQWLKLFPEAPSPQPWQNAFFPLHLLQRPLDKLSYIAHVLLVPTLAERRLLRLPSSLGPLYYLLRPARLGCKWSWQAVCSGFERIMSAGRS